MKKCPNQGYFSVLSQDTNKPEGCKNMCTENQKIKDKIIGDLDERTIDIRFAKETFLRKYGWDMTCSFPDHVWRWCKDIKGQTIAVSLDDAVDMEREIIEYQS